MINLLPPSYTKEIAAARTNTLLFRYVIMMIGTLSFLLLAIVATYVFLVSYGDVADEQREINEQRVGSYAQIQVEADAFRQKLQEAGGLFQSETRYSLALLRMAAAIPEGVRLETLELNENTFDQQLSLNALVAGESAAAALKSSFETSPYFSGVSYGKLSINNSDNSYPYRLEMRVTIHRSIAQ